VFVRSSPFNGTSLYSNGATVILPVASNDTAVLLQAALPLVQQLFRPHKPLQKAGVLLQELQDEATLQHHLLVPLQPEQQRRRAALMATIDRLNRHYGSGTIQWAAAGLHTPWQMRRSQLSGAATTRLEAIPVVHA
jgi:DNA polymerase V